MLAAGVGLTFPTIILPFFFTIDSEIGAVANISLYLGEKSLEKAEKYLGVALCFCFTFRSSGISFFTFFFIDKIRALGGSDKTFFIKNICTLLNFGVLAVIIGTAINTIIRSDGSPKHLWERYLLEFITNIILDPIFIFILDMGVRGAATGTIISVYICYFDFVLFCFWKKSYQAKN